MIQIENDTSEVEKHLLTIQKHDICIFNHIIFLYVFIRYFGYVGKISRLDFPSTQCDDIGSLLKLSFYVFVHIDSIFCALYILYQKVYWFIADYCLNSRCLWSTFKHKIQKHYICMSFLWGRKQYRQIKIKRVLELILIWSIKNQNKAY